MTHDVFICHSSKDRTIANAICSKLEQNRIRCWIAPRDVIPGREYAQSIIEAISGSKLTVLVFSDNSNQSPHVHREIERTVSHGIPILPFRVDDVIPSPALEYFISDAHWLDAITPPMEQHLDHLAGTVRLLLDRAAGGTPGDPAPEPVPSPPAKLPQPPTGGPSGASKLPTWWRWAALGAVALVVVVAAWVLVLGGRHTGGTAAPVATSSAPETTSPATSPPVGRRVQYDKLKSGECLLYPEIRVYEGTGEAFPAVLNVVPCAGKHDAEVFFIGDLWKREQAYPGDAGIVKQFSTHCEKAFETYVGLGYQQSVLTYTGVTPSKDNWSTGDRGVVCLVYDQNGELVGTVKGSSR